jgi:hypothetical protein
VIPSHVVSETLPIFSRDIAKETAAVHETVLPFRCYTARKEKNPFRLPSTPLNSALLLLLLFLPSLPLISIPLCDSLKSPVSFCFALLLRGWFALLQIRPQSNEPSHTLHLCTLAPFRPSLLSRTQFPPFPIPLLCLSSSFSPSSSSSSSSLITRSLSFTSSKQQRFQFVDSD